MTNTNKLWNKFINITFTGYLLNVNRPKQRISDIDSNPSVCVMHNSEQIPSVRFWPEIMLQDHVVVEHK